MDRKLRLLKEDRHYSFVEYQGSVLGHWDFSADGHHDKEIRVERICSKAIVVVDGDVLSKRKRIEDLELGDRFIVLEAKEIENYLPEQVIRNAFAAMEVSGSKGLPDLSALNREHYCTETTGFGSYLDEVCKISKFAASESKSATLCPYWKRKLCKEAVAVMREMNPEDCLEDNIRGLCSSILKHASALSGMEFVPRPAESRAKRSF